MPALVHPNLDRADDLMDEALARRRNGAASWKTHPHEKALTLEELVPEVDTETPHAPVPSARHYTPFALRLARLVYELHKAVPAAGFGYPHGLDEHAVYVFHTTHRPAASARTAYLAVSAGSAPILMPLPELPATLTHGEGVVGDTRLALRAFAVRIAHLVGLALPAALAIAAAPPLEVDMGQEPSPGAAGG